ncbi:MAG: hypothetical protein ABIX10_06075 [Acidimicrobiales bacterium]
MALLAGCAKRSEDLSLLEERATTSSISSPIESSGDAPDATTTSAPEGDVPPTDAVALAENAVVEPSEIPGGWVECCAPSRYTPAELADHICGAPDGLPPRVAGYQRQYGRPVTGGNYDLHLTSAALVSANEEAAELEFTGVDAPGYEACMRDDIAGYVQSGQALPIDDVELTYESEPIDLTVPADLVRLDATYTIADGRGWSRVAVLRLRVGRVLVRLTFDTYDSSPVPTATITGIAQRLIDRLSTT